MSTLRPLSLLFSLDVPTFLVSLFLHLTLFFFPFSLLSLCVVEAGIVTHAPVPAVSYLYLPSPPFHSNICLSGAAGQIT